MKTYSATVKNIIYDPSKGMAGQWFGDLPDGRTVYLFSEEKRLLSKSPSILNLQKTGINYPQGKIIYSNVDITARGMD